MNTRNMRHCWLVAVVMAAVAGSPAPTAAEVLTVPAVTGQVATAWYEQGDHDFLSPGGPKAGWMGTRERAAALLTFDLSFLPPGTTVSSAELQLRIENVVGDPESYGSLSAGVVDPERFENLEPSLLWAYSSRTGAVNCQGTVETGAWLTADATAGVVSRVIEYPATDPGRVTFRVEYPSARPESEERDYVQFSSSARLAVDVQLPNPISQRPVNRHFVRCLPVVASNAGAKHTRWVTELQLASAGEYPSSVWLYFTETETDGTTTFAVRRVDLAQRDLVTYADVLPDLFGLHETKGWLEVLSSNPGVLVTARVANVGGTGSYGQTVPLVDERRAATWHGRRFFDTTRRNLNLGAVDSSNRTNVGFVNLDPTESGVQLTARWTGGNGQATVTVPAFGHVQINRLESIIPNISGKGSFFLEFGPTSGTSRRRIVGYLTRVDNTTGDAVFVVGE